MKPISTFTALGIVILATGAFISGADFFVPTSSKPSGAEAVKIDPASLQTAAARVTLASLDLNLQTTRLVVGGMWCSSCGYIVRKALEDTRGVVDAEVSMSAGTAVVTYDPSACTVEQLLASLAEYGYQARVTVQ